MAQNTYSSPASLPQKVKLLARSARCNSQDASHVGVVDACAAAWAGFLFVKNRCPWCNLRPEQCRNNPTATPQRQKKAINKKGNCSQREKNEQPHCKGTTRGFRAWSSGRRRKQAKSAAVDRLQYQLADKEACRGQGSAPPVMKLFPAVVNHNEHSCF